MSSMPGPVEVVRSRTNSSLKRVGAVRAGKEEGLLLEGERLVRDAARGGHPLELLLVAEDRPDLLEGLEANEVRLVQPDLLSGVSALKTAPGVLALAGRPPVRRLADLELAHDALLLVACGISDPGNLGALSRSAEASGAAGLVVLGGGARPYGSKALRGSMGSLLRLPVAEESQPGELVTGLAAAGFQSVVASTRAGVSWREFDWSGRIALWVAGETGALPQEAHGLSPVSIPMTGGVESLNVTVAASLLLFAAGRVS